MRCKGAQHLAGNRGVRIVDVNRHRHARPGPLARGGEARHHPIHKIGPERGLARRHVRLQCPEPPLVHQFSRPRSPCLGATRFGVARNRVTTPGTVRVSRFDDVRATASHRAVDQDTVARRPAKQAMYRQPGSLPGDVPQRHVDARDGAHLHRTALVATTALIHAVPQPLDAPRVFADQQRLETEDLGDHAIRMVLQIRFAKARDPFVRVNLQPDPRWRDLDQFQ